MRLYKWLVVVAICVASITVSKTAFASSQDDTLFSDVSVKSSSFNVIHDMRDIGVIGGYSDNTFRPNAKITRQQAAVLLNRYRELKYVHLKEFPNLTDVKKTNVNYNALKALQEYGIVEMAKDNKIYPSKSLTREEMAKAIVVTFDINIYPKIKLDFTDVDETNMYSNYISALVREGLINGYNDGTFKPKQELSRAHFATYMHRAITKYDSIQAIKDNNAHYEATGDYLKLTRYKGDFTYSDNGLIKFENKELDDYPLYSYPGFWVEYMDYGGLTYKEHNAKNEAIMQSRRAEIRSTGFTTSTLLMVRNSFNFPELYQAFGKRNGLTEGEVYRLITYLYYTGEVYEHKNFTAYIQYSHSNGYAPAFKFNQGKID